MKSIEYAVFGNFSVADLLEVAKSLKLLIDQNWTPSEQTPPTFDKLLANTGFQAVVMSRRWKTQRAAAKPTTANASSSSTLFTGTVPEFSTFSGS